MHATSRVLAAAMLTRFAFTAPPSRAADRTDWPTRPVRFIVPFPPGGTVDPLARLLGTRLTAALGQQFVVDNRTATWRSRGARKPRTALASR